MVIGVRQETSLAAQGPPAQNETQEERKHTGSGRRVLLPRKNIGILLWSVWWEKLRHG